MSLSLSSPLRSGVSRTRSVVGSFFSSYLLPLLLALFLNCASFALAAPADGDAAAQVSAYAPATILAGVLFILTGLLFCFFGTSMWRFTIFSAGFYVFASLALGILLNVESSTGAFGQNREWILLGVSFAVGIVGGFLAICFYKFGVFLVGAVGGLFLAVFILSLAAGGLISSGIGRTIFMIVLMVVGGLLTLKFEKHVVIIGTAIAGSFLVAVGTDFFIRTGFTDAVERFVHTSQTQPKAAATDLANQNNYEKPGQVYGLFAGMIVLAILGAYTQYKRYTGFGRK